MFMRRGKTTDGWAIIGFGIFAIIVSATWYAGWWGSPPSGSRSQLFAYLGLPLGIIAIIVGIVSLYRDGRRAEKEQRELDSDD
jgi:uncharacterized BrkB/YihY/UPF0761 family membrane protein